MMKIEAEPSKKLRLVVMGTKLNTQLGGNLLGRDGLPYQQ